MRTNQKLLIALTALLLSSCRFDPELPGHDINVSLPIFTTTIEPWDIIPDTLLDGDTTLSLVYEKVLFEINPANLLLNNDSLTSIYMSPPLNVTYQPGQLLYNNSFERVLGDGNTQITHLKVHKGRINVLVTSTIKERIEVFFEISKAEKNYIPFGEKAVVPAATATKNTHLFSFDISDYLFDLRGVTGNKYNRIPITISATIHPDGNPAFFGTSDLFSIDVRFEGLIPEKLWGYFGTSSFSDESETRMPVFQMFKAGGISTHDVKADIHIYNGMGIDAILQLHEMVALNTTTNQQVALNHPIIGRNITVSRAIETPGLPQAVQAVEHHFDLTQGNIVQMLELLPDNLKYGFSGTLNPLGNVSAGRDFFIRNYPMRCSFRLVAPLKLTMNQLKLAEYVEIDLKKQEQVLNHGHFILAAQNAFPFDVKLTIMTCNESNGITDTLLQGGRIAAGKLTNQVAMPIETRIGFTLNNIKSNNLHNSSKLLIEAYLQTPFGGTNYQIDIHQYLKLKLTGDFNIGI